MLADKHKQNYKMLAALQGVDIGDDEESHEELPPEIAAMEAEFRKQKEERQKKSGTFVPGLGYQVQS